MSWYLPWLCMSSKVRWLFPCSDRTRSIVVHCTWRLRPKRLTWRLSNIWHTLVIQWRILTCMGSSQCRSNQNMLFDIQTILIDLSHFMNSLLGIAELQTESYLWIPVVNILLYGNTVVTLLTAWPGISCVPGTAALLESFSWSETRVFEKHIFTLEIYV